jgi:hypothetical protein
MRQAQRGHTCIVNDGTEHAGAAHELDQHARKVFSLRE